jgi:hypothetical protein
MRSKAGALVRALVLFEASYAALAPASGFVDAAFIDTVWLLSKKRICENLAR